MGPMGPMGLMILQRIAEIMKSSKYLFPPLAFAPIFFVAFGIFLLR